MRKYDTSLHVHPFVVPRCPCVFLVHVQVQERGWRVTSRDRRASASDDVGRVQCFQNTALYLRHRRATTFWSRDHPAALNCVSSLLPLQPLLLPIKHKMSDIGSSRNGEEGSGNSQAGSPGGKGKGAWFCRIIESF